jgi:formamidopyrimidine-DNA glycosylase
VPELPEVETVRRGLQQHVAGRGIVAVDLRHPRAFRRHQLGAHDFAARVTNAEVTSIDRRGKYLWLSLDTSDAVVAHLGMSGQFRIVSPSDPIGPHVRIRFSLSDGHELRFVDQRTFGGMAVEPLDEHGIPMSVVHIGLDPFDAGFDPAGANRAFRTKHTEIKRALLDQTLVSGIGNIYADEALWRARLHFQRRTDRLSSRQIADVLEAATVVMTDALAQGGTSFDSLYVNVNGESGYFERSLEVYDQEGEPCSRCGTPIRRTAFMNRSSFYCPRCQRPGRAA